MNIYGTYYKTTTFEDIGPQGLHRFQLNCFLGETSGIIPHGSVHSSLKLVAKPTFLTPFC